MLVSAGFERQAAKVEGGHVENGVKVGGVCKQGELVDGIVQNNRPVLHAFTIPRKSRGGPLGGE